MPVRDDARRPDQVSVRQRLRWALTRPLAGDEVRGAFWVRHLRIGVVLTGLSAAFVALYALAVPDRPHRLALAGAAATAALLSPLLLRLPMHRMALDHRGRPFFYSWSLVLTLVITIMALLDGGGGSFLNLLYVLTLTFAAVAYPPGGVAVLGTVMVAADAGLALSVGSGPSAEVWATIAMLTLFTAMSAWSARNQWEAHQQQELVARTLETLASTDPLTTCLNRRAFMHRLAVGIAEPVPTSSLFLVDLDGFKAVNDTRGHAAGDEVLVQVAAAIRRAARDVDSVARLGGDEFAVLCRQRGGDARAQLAGDIRREIAAAGVGYGVTGSVGYTVLQGQDTPVSALQRADRAMYRSKVAGGDRVHAA